MKGKVYLIGAGPGDLGLMTLKAVEVLKQADTVVFDRLINPHVLKLVPKDVELIDVSKFPGNHTIPQAEINCILADKALQGKKVIRLKGGDPFVFGRGGEEALHLYGRGIDFEVIPGVTSAVSVLAYAGIPVTHRGIASSFHVITGHGKSEDDFPDFEALAKLEGTLVFLMGIKNMEHIIGRLIECGKPADTPTAVIMNGTTPYQKIAVGTLSNICDNAKKGNIKNPAVIVVGDVVKLRSKLSWYENGRLFGKRILFVGSFDKQNGMPNSGSPLQRLRQEGADVFIYPTLNITTIKQNVKKLIDGIQSFDILIFTSKNGVESFVKCMKEYKLDARYLHNKQIWAVGPQTAAKLSQAHLYADVVPDTYTSKALLNHVTQEDKGKRAAIITSDIGGERIISGLTSCGLKAHKVIAYENRPNIEVKEQLLEVIHDGIDMAIFTSPSSFNFMREIVGDEIEALKDAQIAVIGPVTKQAIQTAGYTVDIMPQEHTLKGLSEEILAYY